MKLIEGKPSENFFDQNPEVRYYDYVKDIYDTYGREQASNIMWAIYLTEDPNSKFYNHPREDRRDMVKTNYLEQDDFDWEEHSELIGSYKRLFLSKGEIMFKIWNDKMEEMTAWLDGMSFENDSKEIKDLLKNVKKYWDDFEEIQEDFDKLKEQEKQARGDVQFGGAAKKAHKDG